MFPLKPLLLSREILQYPLWARIHLILLKKTQVKGYSLQASVLALCHVQLDLSNLMFSSLNNLNISLGTEM